MNENIIFGNIVKSVVGVCVVLVLSCPLWAGSPADKAKKQRSKNMHAIVFLEVPIKNFGTPDQRKSYEEIKFKYARALSLFFEDDFVRAYNSFLGVQKKLEKIYEKLSVEYINRTELILQQSIQILVEVDIRYHPKADIVNRILTNIEPPNEKPYYKEKEFHFIDDKKAMVRNIDRAYYLLGHAKKLRRKAINLVANLEEESPIPSRYRAQRVQDYKKTIEICRLAKRNGIRVYQYINKNKLSDAEPSFKDNPTFFEKKIDPVFDPSIPKDYVLDLNDAYNRIHALEVDYKIFLKKYNRKNDK